MPTRSIRAIVFDIGGAIVRVHVPPMVEALAGKPAPPACPSPKAGPTLHAPIV